MDLASGWIPTTTFVLGLVGFILVINGALQLILGLGGGGGVVCYLVLLHEEIIKEVSK